MVIVESTLNQKKFNLKKTLTILGFTGLVIIIIVPISLVILGQTASPTGNLISPLPAGELSQNPSPTTTPTPSLASLINLSQNYLDKAYQLAQNQQQTAADKKEIIITLNYSLDQVNSAINLSPQTPQAYLLRAKILTAISKINPQALAKAQKDLETAQGLSNGQPITLPEPVNPLNLLPDQQASLPQNLIIADPKQAPLSSTSAAPTTNALTQTITLPANQTELVVDTPHIQADSLIYLIPQTKTAAPVFVKSKTIGSFTINTSSPSATDQTIDYWIINP